MVISPIGYSIPNIGLYYPILGQPNNSLMSSSVEAGIVAIHAVQWNASIVASRGQGAADSLARCLKKCTEQLECLA